MSKKALTVFLEEQIQDAVELRLDLSGSELTAVEVLQEILARSGTPEGAEAP